MKEGRKRGREGGRGKGRNKGKRKEERKITPYKHLPCVGSFAQIGAGAHHSPHREVFLSLFCR